MRVIHQRYKCIGCGACAAVCPMYFKMKDDGKAELINGKKVKNDFGLEVAKVTDELKDAESACPVMCIKIK